MFFLSFSINILFVNKNVNKMEFNSDDMDDFGADALYPIPIIKIKT